MKSDYIAASIIPDSDSESEKEEIIITPKKIRKPKVLQQPLQKFYKEDANIFEIGVDEAGRGPLFFESPSRIWTRADHPTHGTLMKR